MFRFLWNSCQVRILFYTLVSLAGYNSISNSAGADIKIGDRVIVQSSHGSKAGVLRYYGNTEFGTGLWCGVELDDPLGKNDGSVAGVRYVLNICRAKLNCTSKKQTSYILFLILGISIVLQNLVCLYRLKKLAGLRFQTKKLLALYTLMVLLDKVLLIQFELPLRLSIRAFRVLRVILG